MPQQIYLFILVFQVLALCHTAGALTRLDAEYSQPLSYLRLAASPFLAEHDVVVQKGARLVIEPGCEIRFAKGRELTVYGVLDARGNSTHRIKFTKMAQQREQATRGGSGLYRLVEGDDMLSGKLQIFHNAKWNYVCGTQFK